MSKNISKYLHQHMDKKAGFDHSIKRTKIVATVGRLVIIMILW